MSEPAPVYTDRRRAEAFGAVAADYDRYRPRYPDALITHIVDRPGLRILDVGAGTGISSTQLIEAGARVIAVEPDPRMAEICAAKGITVEHSTFEQWDPAGRHFDAVVFGQSFHWVQPGPALAKVASVLSDSAHLVLMWNRITPVSPSRADLDSVYAEYSSVGQSTPVDPAAEAAVIAVIEEHGFTAKRVDFNEELHYRTDDWLGMVATQSNHLVMEPGPGAELLARLRERIGAGGVSARNQALALFCTRTVER